MPFAERRKHPRIPGSVPCQISIGEAIFVTETTNISCGGALCRLTRPIPVMTKLKISLELPAQTGRSRSTLRCLGVVVRQEPHTDPSGNSSYLTAIFFSEIKPEDRRRIAEFILQDMLSRNRRAA